MDVLLVTGGAGFIGSNFVRLALSRTPGRVVVVDALTYAGHRATLADLEGHPRFSFVHADIADAAGMARVFDQHQPTRVVNFAAETHVDRSIDGPRAFVQTNLIGVYELLQAARRRVAALDAEGQARFRFLHVSTDEVYGSLGPEGAFTEETPYAPNSPYAATKAGADHLVRAWGETFRLPAIITNCSNNYGPYQFPEKLIPLMILNALDARPLPIYGDGGAVRDWLYVEDHCEGVLLALERGGVGEKYNIGGVAERNTLQVMRALCAILDETRPAAQNPAMAARGLTRYEALATFVPDRPGHDRR
jgi:dTDP-glucose 4,6-dehydratase